MLRRSYRIEMDTTQRWIVLYSDFITLLFALFVVLYAVSSINVAKYKDAIKSLSGAFNKTPESQTSKDPLLERVAYPEGSFEEIVESPILDQDVIKHSRKQWTEIELKENALFSPGEATLNGNAKGLLKKISDSLKANTFPIVIEGHTDNIPIKTPQFPSNWELSATRAAVVARSLIANGLDPKLISAVGHADQKPIATNDTPEGRSKNRRVVLVIERTKE